MVMISMGRGATKKLDWDSVQQAFYDVIDTIPDDVKILPKKDFLANVCRRYFEVSGHTVSYYNHMPVERFGPMFSETKYLDCGWKTVTRKVLRKDLAGNFKTDARFITRVIV